MASSREIDATYNYMDLLFRRTLGENADITCAMYDNDFSKSLERAQRDKHDYILRNTGFYPGARVLDIGCGWGGFLKAIRDRQGIGTGLTLSKAQARACRRNGFDVRLMDWKDISPGTLGTVAVVVSIGSFEHFCSEEEFIARKQDWIYSRFFEFCHSILPNKGRLFLQTMLWGRRVPEPAEISLGAKKGSDEYILAVLRRFYPGSWLPSGAEQITRAADSYFRLISSKNGKTDYIQTMTEWGLRMRRFRAANLLAYVRSVRWILTDADARYKLETLLASYNRECFKRELMDHERMVFEKL